MFGKSSVSFQSLVLLVCIFSQRWMWWEKKNLGWGFRSSASTLERQTTVQSYASPCWYRYTKTACSSCSGGQSQRSLWITLWSLKGINWTYTCEIAVGFPHGPRVWDWICKKVLDLAVPIANKLMSFNGSDLLSPWPHQISISPSLTPIPPLFFGSEQCRQSILMAVNHSTPSEN